MPLLRQFVPRRARVDHSERAVESSRDQRQILAEAALRITGIGNANNKKVVALARFIGDRLWPARGLPSDDVHLPRLLLVRMSVERGRCFGRALDRLFGTLSIRLCVVRRLASRRRRSFGFFRV